jgi:hypothetical protein
VYLTYELLLSKGTTEGNLMKLKEISVMGLLGLMTAMPSSVAQQNSIREQLVGTWSFVASNAKLPDGSPSWGNNPKGLFIIAEDGHFSWQVFRSDRLQLASNNRFRATPAELDANNRGTLAYFGTYTVDEASKVITFITQASTFPNSEGEVIKRIITRLTADELSYTNPANTSGERVEAVWTRAR